MKKVSEPPKYASRFLSWYCRPELLEDLEGALLEYYHERVNAGNHRKARWMFWLDVLMHVRPHTVKINTQTSGLMLSNHVKVSVRNIRKHKLSTMLNTVGLASGLACFILIFLWINKELNYDTFHEKKDRIYRVPNTFKSESETFSQAISGSALGLQLDDHFSEIEASTRFYRTSERLQINNQYFFESGLGVVDNNFLEIFDFELISGNRKELLNDPQSIVLTKSLANKFFGNQNPLNKTITLGEIELQVTGILEDLPETSQLQFSALVPTQTFKRHWGWESMDTNWGGGSFYTYVLITEGTNPDELGQAITAFIGDKLKDWAEHGMYYQYFLQPLTSIHLTSDLRYDFNNGNLQTVQVFIAAALVILLLACINYINLATANAISRSKEVGIRKVIGVRQKQLITQYLVESFLIIVLSVGLALLMVWAILPLYKQLTGYEHFQLVTLKNVSFLFGIVIALSLMAGSLPAYLISKVPPLRVIKGNLKSGMQFNM
ncbi:MAG: ABC transporter permease, partial [Ekhidna sp.]